MNLDSLWVCVQWEKAWYSDHKQLAAACAMFSLSLGIQVISSWELQLMGHGGDEEISFKLSYCCIWSVTKNHYIHMWQGLFGSISKSYMFCLMARLKLQDIVWLWWLLVYECHDDTFFIWWIPIQLIFNIVDVITYYAM